jgi:hypothetical protein
MTKICPNPVTLSSFLIKKKGRIHFGWCIIDPISTEVENNCLNFRYQSLSWIKNNINSSRHSSLIICYVNIGTYMQSKRIDKSKSIWKFYFCFGQKIYFSIDLKIRKYRQNFKTCLDAVRIRNKSGTKRDQSNKWKKEKKSWFDPSSIPIRTLQALQEEKIRSKKIFIQNLISPFRVRTGWPDESVKNRPKGNPIRFLWKI